MEQIKPERRHDLDWLRALLVFCVFLFHCGAFFTTWHWHVKNETLSPGVELFTDFLSLWMLPTIFIVSAAGIWYSLGYQRPLRFIRGKTLRLFVPLVFGALVLSPHQQYFDRLTRGEFSGSFLEFLPHYFQGLDALGGNFAWHGFHLWYLLWLFVFSLLLLPLFLFLRSKQGLPVVRAIGSFLKIPGTIYLLGLVLAVPMDTIDEKSLWGIRIWAGWNLVYYLILLFLGFLIFADERIQKTIIRQRYISLVLGMALIVGLKLGITVPPSTIDLGMYQHTLASWCLINAVLGFGMRYLTTFNSFLRYASEAVITFYILHQAVILLLGYWLVRLRIPIIAKYFIIAILSFAAIMGLYEGIRRVDLLRFLFGMKLKRQKMS